MDERTDDDMDFVKLFSSLDSITASDDLKKSTLDAILSGAAGSDSGSGTVPAEIKQDTKVIQFSRGGKHGKRKPRTLRIAGLAACVALFGAGTFAYTMPIARASIDDGDTSLTLGINSLGMTVSADADSDKGKKLIAENDLTNKNYRDSVGEVATSIATHSDAAESNISLSVSADNEAQRESVKKGSSEAIEISGYAKKAPVAKATAKDDSSASSASSADNQASENAETNDTDNDNDDDVVSFEVNTEEAQENQKASENKDSSGQESKYHPLSDDKQASESDSTSAASSEESAEETTAATADTVSADE